MTGLLVGRRTPRFAMRALDEVMKEDSDEDTDLVRIRKNHAPISNDESQF